MKQNCNGVEIYKNKPTQLTLFKPTNPKYQAAWPGCALPCNSTNKAAGQFSTGYIHIVIQVLEK